MAALSSALTSWLDIPEESDFSLENIPFGVFSLSPASTKRCATAIGNKVVDLSILQEAGCLDNIPGLSANAFVGQETLNAFVGHRPVVWKHVRQRLQELFRKDSVNNATNLQNNPQLQKAALHDLDQVSLHLPLQVGDYTDFYASREHATNVGTMFRGKDNALQPNWLHLPVGYHGRASTLVVSGQPVKRPCGQLQKDNQDPSQGSVFGPCQQMDFELEVGAVVGGPANELGTPLSMEEAKERIFGYCLLNDWSARDLQKWEYVPLGPFTSKNFATTVSPWIVTSLALQEGGFACPTSAIEQTNPTPLQYLQDPAYSSYNIQLSVAIQSSSMSTATTVCQSNFKNLYWNPAQFLVHHSVTGCVMKAGDLLGSGTISGSTPESFGSMLELSWKGTRPVELNENESRTFLEDGDKVIIKGFCQKTKTADGSKPPRIGFGICEGQVLPATPSIMKKQSQVSQQSTSNNDRYTNFKLYGFWKSSSTWRVRVALAAKEISYEKVSINFLKGEQHEPSYRDYVNSLGQVPVLEFTDTWQLRDAPLEEAKAAVIRLSQSIAIIEFLDSAFPDRRSLFPQNDPMTKAIAYQMVEVINSGTQPLQNLPFLMRIEEQSEKRVLVNDVAKGVIEKGLEAVEVLVVEHHARLADQQGPYCLGTFSPSVVEAFVVPQMANARRFGVALDQVCPTLARIDALCSDHPWFQEAHPDVQPDAGT